MPNGLQLFRKNGSLFGAKSIVMLLLACVIVFSEGCSKKMPCPDAAKVAKKAQKKKNKTKSVKTPASEDPEATADAGTTDNTESTATADNSGGGATADTEEESDKKQSFSGVKANYTKNGLLKKKKYKNLRNNPAKKTTRVKKNSIFNVFSKK